MTSFTDIFGGSNIVPTQPSFLSLNPLTANVILGWPLEQTGFGPDIVADIIEVNATAPALTIKLSDATQISNGYTILFNNIGANTFTVLDSTGATIVSVASGTVWQLYLASNATAAGTWRIFQYGAGASSANAAALAGAGLLAITTTLNENIVVKPENTNYVSTTADRALAIEWTGGTGTITLPNAGTATSGWFTIVKNSGSGIVTVSPPSGTIDQAASLAFDPDQSAIIVCDGTNYFTIGFGQQLNSIFDFVQIDLTGDSGNVVLSGADLNRISYRFVGAIVGNVNIIVPNVIQQYWVDNETSGAFTLIVKTLAGTGIAVAQGTRNILYCDGSNVLNAVSFGSTGFANGSAGSPSIFFSASPSTGIYSPAANSFGITVNGVERLNIDATGKFIFESPDNAAAPGFIFNQSSTGAGTTVEIISAFGSISTNPLLALKSSAAGGFATLSIAGNNGTAGTNDLSIFQNGATGEAQVLNRHATGHLKLGANSIVGIDIDQTGHVTFPVGLLFADGTGLAPSISFQSSQTSGIYLATALGPNNAEEMRSWVSTVATGGTWDIACGYDPVAGGYTDVINLATHSAAPSGDPLNVVHGFTNTLYFGSGSSATASAGAATLPANPVGFLQWTRGSTTIKIPYYAN